VAILLPETERNELIEAIEDDKHAGNRNRYRGPKVLGF
jgi:hypothetical protein